MASNFENYYLLLGLSFTLVLSLVLIFIYSGSYQESFTELYFEDHTTLPSTIELNKEYEYSFSIHNLEQETTTYTYTIYIEFEDGTTREQEEQFITLNNEETATIQESFALEDTFQGSAKVVVELNTGEEIHFWITQE